MSSSIGQSSLQDALGSSIIAGEGVAGTPTGGVVSVQGVSGGTALPISAAALPLPAGAATAANQATEITSLASIQTTSNSTATNTNTVMANQTNGTQRTLVTDLVGNLQPAGASAATTIYVRLNDGTSNISSTTINSKDRLDVDLSSEAVDGATAPFSTVQVGGKDSSGNIQTLETLSTGELFTRDVLNTAGQNRAQSVTTTAAEALGGSTILANRKMLTVRPTNGIIYWGFTTGVTTTTGTPIYTNEVFSISATDNLHIYVISAGTVDVRMSEAS